MKVLLAILASLIVFSVSCSEENKDDDNESVSLSESAFKGMFLGQGKAWDNQGWESECSQVRFAFGRTPDSISIMMGRYECGKKELGWKPITLGIKDGSLDYQGVPVGSISNNRIFVSVANSESQARFVVEKTAQGISVSEFMAGNVDGVAYELNTQAELMPTPQIGDNIYAGNWVGEGQIIETGQDKKKCEEVKFVISRKPTSLTIEEAYYKCGSETITWNKITLKIRDGQLYIGDKHIGFIDNDKIDIHVESTESIQKFIVKVRGNGLKVTEYYKDKSKNHEITLKAQLKAKRNLLNSDRLFMKPKHFSESIADFTQGH